MKIVYRTGYSTVALRALVRFALLPELRKNERLNSWDDFKLSFYYHPDTTLRKHSGQYQGDRIKIYLHSAQFLTLRAEESNFRWHTIGGQSDPMYRLPAKEQVKCKNLADEILAIIAHDLYHWLGKALANRYDDEQAAERYSAKVIKRWHRDTEDRPFVTKWLAKSAYSERNSTRFERWLRKLPG